MVKLIVANWKSNPETLREAIALARASDFKDVVIAPPYPYLEQVGKLIRKASLGAQNTFWEDGGPYTGEVSVGQLRRLKVKYVIIGHSERRKNLNETDQMINKKVRTALKAGLKVILCVGEDWNTRRRGIATAKQLVGKQLKNNLAGIRNAKLEIRNLAIAYEPVWAIGTGKSDSPENSAQIITHIRNILNTRYLIRDTKVLYGGSVAPQNAKSFLSRPESNGALVGGASLNAQSFKAIIKARDSI